MSCHKVIIPTGYMGSGSSAITDLLSEVDGINTSKGSFEYVFLHCPNGVFDLEDKLLLGNNAVRSDEALHVFYETMRQLYDKKFWWVGHYRENIGEHFLKIIEKYVDRLTEFQNDFYWYYQENVQAKMVPRLIVNKILQKNPFGKHYEKKALQYSPMWLSFATPKEFYSYTKEMIYEILNIMGKKESHIVLDQLVLPFNLHRIDNYFDDDIRVVVVERDPRDTFILNKYFWSKNNTLVPYPTEVEDFCKYFLRLRKSEKKYIGNKVKRIKFEDLIYKYDNTVKNILEWLEIDKEKHINPRSHFIPELSVNNTQLFNRESKFKEECEYIEEKLADYLYCFPYDIKKFEKTIF